MTAIASPAPVSPWPAPLRRNRIILLPDDSAARPALTGGSYLDCGELQTLLGQGALVERWQEWECWYTGAESGGDHDTETGHWLDVVRVWLPAGCSPAEIARLTRQVSNLGDRRAAGPVAMWDDLVVAEGDGTAILTARYGPAISDVAYHEDESEVWTADERAAVRVAQAAAAWATLRGWVAAVCAAARP